MEKFMLVEFTRKTGKITKTLEGYGQALLKLYALQNLTKTRDAILFNKETGEVITYFEGNGSFPKVIDGNGENIEDYCEGLLEVNR